MKRVATFAGVDDQQREAIRAALRAQDIPFHENAPSLIWPGDLWVVHDEDYDRARALVQATEAALAERARSEFDREYAERWRGSYWRWLFGRIREEPVRLAMIAALVAVIWFGVLWWFVR
jgi:hypothetical protein